MADWGVFDANCAVGRHLHWHGGQPQSAEDLLAALDHHGVGQALVLDSLAREHHPQDGNARVTATVADQPRLRAVWGLLPTVGTDEQPGGEALLAALRAARVGAVAFHPGQFRFTLDDWCVDAVLEPVAAAGVPLFICPNEFGPAGPGAMDQTDWSGVVALCRRWPNLPVIVSESRVRRSQRLAYRALEAADNLHLELSGWWLHRGIEFLSRTFGAHRLVYGSNWPLYGMGQTLAMLACAEIDDADRRLIAGDNLRRLVAWADPAPEPAPAITFPPPADPYVAWGRSGQPPADEPAVVDCHGHLGPTAAHYHIPDGTLPAVVAEMGRHGVERTCVFSFTGVFGDEQPGNDLVAAAVAAYPERFVGFTLVNPNHGAAAMQAELERGAALGLRGVKLIAAYHGYPEEGELIRVACAWAHEHEQLILHHHWGSPAWLEKLLVDYPRACFLTGHSTAAYAELMRRHEHLYVCTCPLLGPTAAEDLVAALGAERILFGSDLEDLPIAWGLGPLLFARLSVSEKRAILGNNLRGLLARYSRG